MEHGKIVGIGFHKTGLSSLKTALEILGFSTIKGQQAYIQSISQAEGVECLATGKYEKLLNYILPYEAMVDNPWNLLFKEIDGAFPNSKFILTIREEGQWLESAKRYFSQRPYSAIRQWIYGTTQIEGNEEIYLSKYREHNEAVRAYFKDRPQDLLILDFTDRETWDQLCSFLGKPILHLPFPQQNSTISPQSE